MIYVIGAVTGIDGRNRGAFEEVRQGRQARVFQILRGGRMIDKWQFDSLKVMLAFETYLGITPHEWTQADADTLEQ